MTIREYYASYKSLLGVLAGVVTASPLLALIPFEIDKYVFPPLGDVELIARVITFAVVLLTTFVVYFYRTANIVRAIFTAGILFIFFSACYAASFSLFVRTIPIPARDTSVSFSVGINRTEFAKKNFPDVSDEQMLRYRGLTEEEVRHCWTPASLLAARAILWLSCTLSLLFLVAALGLGIVAGCPTSRL
jgi:hypothetical protein